MLEEISRRVKGLEPFLLGVSRDIRIVVKNARVLQLSRPRDVANYSLSCCAQCVYGDCIAVLEKKSYCCGKVAFPRVQFRDDRQVTPNLCTRTVQGYAFGIHLARPAVHSLFSGDGGARLRPSFAVPAAGAEPRTHELTNKGPRGAARQGQSVTNVESQAPRSGKPYAHC